MALYANEAGAIKDLSSTKYLGNGFTFHGIDCIRNGTERIDVSQSALNEFCTFPDNHILSDYIFIVFWGSYPYYESTSNVTPNKKAAIIFDLPGITRPGTSTYLRINLIDGLNWYIDINPKPVLTDTGIRINQPKGYSDEYHFWIFGIR